MKQWIDERKDMLRGVARRVGALDLLARERAQAAAGRVGGTSHVDGHGDPAEAMSANASSEESPWTRRLILFLRVMAALALIKGLFHWSRVCGIGTGAAFSFEMQSLPYQTATVYFAVIELVAAVGLWLATPWGAVVWLTAIVSMAVVELMFPMIYGGGLFIVGFDVVLLAGYFVLAFLSAQERPA